MGCIAPLTSPHTPPSLCRLSRRFDITVRGKGGHGAAPAGTVDAIVEAAHLVVALQTVVSRSIDPLDSGVVTVGK
ncbi:peptidase dimerization domain-containing protein, partial [Vibrio cholerae]|uniref:peptidase dimerization domain-containing protein n=1 Tax=Vibrio cholerae TaxID=666 RepID=UPI00301B7713